MNTAHRTASKHSKARYFTAGLAIVVPLSAMAFAPAAHADTLDPTYTSSVNPTDDTGNSLPITIQANNAANAWSVISSDPSYATFATIVQNAGLQSAFQGSTPATFLAPTEAAFADAGPDVVARLTDPTNTAGAAAFVNGLVSNNNPSLMDFERAVPGAIDPALITTTTCTPFTYTDAYGVTYNVEQRDLFDDPNAWSSRTASRPHHQPQRPEPQRQP